MDSNGQECRGAIDLLCLSSDERDASNAVATRDEDNEDDPLDQKQAMTTADVSHQAVDLGVAAQLRNNKPVKKDERFTASPPPRPPRFVPRLRTTAVSKDLAIHTSLP
jgi:hypothetical protein